MVVVVLVRLPQLPQPPLLCIVWLKTGPPGTAPEVHFRRFDAERRGVALKRSDFKKVRFGGLDGYCLGLPEVRICWAGLVSGLPGSGSSLLV